jgi:tRNA A37 threonylcarbamoyladenosine dehydratase
MDENFWLNRTELLIGSEKIEALRNAHVLIAGLGGVGGYAAEAICRAGVGEITIVDDDVVKPSNRNRQLLALTSTENRLKTELMAERLMDINPHINLHVRKTYLKDEKIPELLQAPFNYVIDAIDTLSPKIYFIKNCLDRKLPLVSSMGAGGRFDPLLIHVADLAETYGCTFAQAVRKKLHGLGIRTGFKVVFSSEPVPKEVIKVTDHEANKKSTVGTISYMPAMFGLVAASVAIRGLINPDSAKKSGFINPE